MKIHFSIPDSNMIRPLNIYFLKILLEHPEWFYDDFVIDSAYGCPLECIWTSGRTKSNFNLTSIEQFNKTVNFFNKYNIKYRVVLSNNIIGKEFLDDKYTNQILSKINSINGYATIASDVLFNYVGDKYPNINRCWSILKDYGNTLEEEIDNINKLSTNNTVVIPHYLNNKCSVFSNKNNIEILINQLGCIDTKCVYMKEHIENIHMEAYKNQDFEFNKCLFSKQLMWDDNIDKTFFNHYSHVITRSKIYSFANQGYNHYKIIDRIDLAITMVTYLHYFVKKEYRDIFYNAYKKLFATDNLLIHEKNMKMIMKFYDGELIK